MGSLSACASLRPAVPEVLYKAHFEAVPDSVCAELATALTDQINLARDSSYEIPLGASRCHEILYAQDGNEVWIHLWGNELSIAVRNYPNPGDLEEPTANSRSLADAAIGILKDAHPDVLVERARESTLD